MINVIFTALNVLGIFALLMSIMDRSFFEDVLGEQKLYIKIASAIIAVYDFIIQDYFSEGLIILFSATIDPKL